MAPMPIADYYAEQNAQINLMNAKGRYQSNKYRQEEANTEAFEKKKKAALKELNKAEMAIYNKSNANPDKDVNTYAESLNQIQTYKDQVANAKSEGDLSAPTEYARVFT